MIQNVPGDILKILQGHSLSSKQIEELSSRLSSKISEKLLAQHKPSFRMSNWSYWDRKLYYTINRPEKSEPLSDETRLKFLYGDIIEEVVFFLLEQSDHEVKDRQKEVEIKGVKGHIDGIVDGVLVDVKSANSRSFDKFRYHMLHNDDSFGYLDQISLYLHASKDNPNLKVKGEAGFLAIDKELGHIVVDVYKKKETDFEKETIRKHYMLSLPTEPPKCFQPVPEGRSGNERLPVQCSYCSFKFHCHRNSNEGAGLQAYSYSGGPKFLTKIVREPEVSNITKEYKSKNSITW